MGTVGDSTAYNLFAHNWCGLDSSGTKDLGNGFYGAHFGGLANRVSHNNLSGNRCGVVISGYSERCVLEDNTIGILPDLETLLPNDESGVRIQDNALRDSLMDNRIIGNAGWGVELKGAAVRRTTLSHNGISMNASGGILLEDGANGGIAAPVVQTVDPWPGWIRGTAPPNARVELFGWVSAGVDGAWSWEGMYAGPNVTATATDGEGNTSAFSAPFAMPTGLKGPPPGMPDRHALFQNYPNPFNPSTTIRFDVEEPCRVVLRVLDIRGGEVAVLADGRYEAGSHAVRFDASALPSGIYVCRLEAGDFRVARKMTVIK
jgi:hypothetical protein